MKLIYKHEIKAGEKVTQDEIIKILLENRNITDLKEFLNPPSPLSLSLKDFGYIDEITKSMKILEEIKKKGETIVVYTDYDADGITGGSILWETLHLLGFKVMPYVPHRQLEGYGFSTIGIDNVKKEYNPSLIISVDHGIAAREQIAYAKTIGIPVIVTDHHHKPELIPDKAEAIFHIPLLSGSGVSYFFAKEVFNHFKDDSKHKKLLEKYFEADYMALASIGTVADLVPLVGPSRSLVKHGLMAFPRVERVGIKHLCKEAGIEGRTITPYEIGFVIAPRINAVGRLEHAIDALRLLCTTSEERAYTLASKVGSKNSERKDLVKVSVEEALEMVEELKAKGELHKIIILHSPSWHEGIIGLIASKLLEKYYRPVIIMAEADGQFKGSARSIFAFHITDFFTSMKEYFLGFGGHRQAAGFTMKKDLLEKFLQEAIEKADNMIKDEDLEKVIEADIKVPLGMLTINLAKRIEGLAPFGIGNTQPIFMSEVLVDNAQLFGKESDHLKVIIKDETGKCKLELIKFGAAEDFSKLSRDQKLQVVYQLDINRWNGRETLRGRIISFL